MPVSDTGWPLALRVEADAHQGRALREAAQAGLLVVPAVVLHEYLAVLGRQVARVRSPREGSKVARAALEGLRAQPNIRISNDLVLDHV